MRQQNTTIENDSNLICKYGNPTIIFEKQTTHTIKTRKLKARQMALKTTLLLQFYQRQRIIKRE